VCYYEIKLWQKYLNKRRINMPAKKRKKAKKATKKRKKATKKKATKRK